MSALRSQKRTGADQTMTRRCFVGALAQCAAAGCGTWLSSASAAVGPAPRLPRVELVDQDGRTRDLGTFVQGPLLLNFFYTGCSSVCPPQTAALRALRERLSQTRSDRALPMQLSVTVDALGDGPAELRRYAGRFGLHLGLMQRWLMLTGRPTALDEVWRAFDVPAGNVDDHPSTLWIRPGTGAAWRRASLLGDPDALARLVAEVTA